VQSLTPKRAAELLEANTTNRPLSRPVVRAFAEAMRRGDWLITHQGIAFDVNGVLVDGQHRLAAIIEADLPIDVTVFTDVAEGTFDVPATGMIKSAAGAASYLIEQANKRVDLTGWFDGIVDGAGLDRQDPRLLFRRVMFSMARKQAGQVQRRRDTREHFALYVKGFNAWATAEPITSLRFTPRESMPRIAKAR
jgi:hypothetical protein